MKLINYKNPIKSFCEILVIKVSFVPSLDDQ